MPMNIRLTELLTPAGNKPSYTAAAGYRSGLIEKVKLIGSFGIDGANAPLNLLGDPFSVVRTGVGLYTVTFGVATIAGKTFSVKEVIALLPVLQKSAASVLRAEPGVITASAGTAQIRIVDAAGAVANPVAAGASERVHFEATVSVGAL